MPTTAAEATTTILTDDPADELTVQPVDETSASSATIATVTAPAEPAADGFATRQVDRLMTVPTQRAVPTQAQPPSPPQPVQSPVIPPSSTDPTDRLTRRTLGVLRRQGGRVLVTGRTDAPDVVARRLLVRAPALAARATCEDIVTLARRVLAERKIEVCTDQDLVDAAWVTAWERVGQHTLLRGLGDPARWRAEIAGTIKGRDLVRFSQYRDSVLSQYRDNTSRLAPAVWDLYVAYTEELTRRFAHDQADLVAIALDELTVTPSRNRFSVVVLDPTLPLTPTMVRLLRALTVAR